jgi:hypothetical protein
MSDDTQLAPWEKDLEPGVAAGELYKRHLKTLPVVSVNSRSTPRKASRVVSATTDGGGVHLLNHATDYDAEVHLICETTAINPNWIDTEKLHLHGQVYFNVFVDGIDWDNYTGHALPTHKSSATEERVWKDELDREMAALAEMAGFEIPDHVKVSGGE